MMTNLVAELREKARSQLIGEPELLNDAADEIERLRSVLQRIAASHGASDHSCSRRDLADRALAGPADEPACEHDLVLLAGTLDSTGEHYEYKCKKCPERIFKDVPL